MKMAIRSLRHTARMFVPALAIISVLGVGEAAQAACYGSGQQLPPRVVSQFMNEPGKLLTQFPSGGAQMISLIRDLVASDPGTLALVTELNAKANPDQVEAIGTGLGQAALVCARTAQAFSDEIQRVTIAANNKPMTQAFGAVMGDQFLGLATPAVGGGGGATGQTASAGGAATSGAPLGLATSVSNTSTTASSSTSSGSTAVAAAGGASGIPGGSAPSNGLAIGTSAANAGGTVLGVNASNAILGGNSTGNAILGGNSSGKVLGGNASSTILGGSSSGTISGGPSVLGSVSTSNFLPNVSRAISVSPQ
jgi:hypothetical protein